MFSPQAYLVDEAYHLTFPCPGQKVAGAQVCLSGTAQAACSAKVHIFVAVWTFQETRALLAVALSATLQQIRRVLFGPRGPHSTLSRRFAYRAHLAEHCLRPLQVAQQCMRKWLRSLMPASPDLAQAEHQVLSLCPSEQRCCCRDSSAGYDVSYSEISMIDSCGVINTSTVHLDILLMHTELADIHAHSGGGAQMIQVRHRADLDRGSNESHPLCHFLGNRITSVIRYCDCE